MMSKRSMLALLSTAVVVFVTGCESDDGTDSSERGGLPHAITTTPAEVSAAVIETDKSAVHLVRVGDDWRPTAGDELSSATQMGMVEQYVLPLPAYRAVKLDVAKPSYGLTEPWLTVRIFEKDGDRHRLEVGSGTFNRSGFYASRDGGSRAFLLVRDSVAYLMSVALGRQVTMPDPADKRIDRKISSGSYSDDAPLDAAEFGRAADAWLQQSLQASLGGNG